MTKAAKPPDPEHPYGHEKIENLSALFETLFLVFTCIWIIYEAVNRLTEGSPPIIVNFWSYFVVISAILIDIWRSRALSKAARETNSPALEADAVHFSSDIGSSVVVLIGLVCSQAGFHEADSFAALVVALIVLYICGRLGMKAVDALIDRVPRGAPEAAEKAALTVQGVTRAYDIKVREAGDAQFVEMKVKMDSGLPLLEVHRITSETENEVARAFSNARVIIHPEPEDSRGGIYENVLALSGSAGARLHDFTVFETDAGMEVSVHLEWKEDTLFSEAWRRTSEIEQRLKDSYPDISSLFIHFEPSVEKLASSFEVAEAESLARIRDRVASLEEPLSRTKVRLIQSDKTLYIHLTFPVTGDLTIARVHELSTIVESAVLPLGPEKSRVVARAVPLDHFEKSR